VIAALFVQRDGAYYGLPDVDPWDEARDARKYPGPHPVVAHPPCSRWCRLAGLVEARWGYKRGEDGGCFASALGSVRTWGGVLEHPAYSDAWATYGHRAKKATWLYAYGITPPPLRWSATPDNAVTAYVTDGGGRVKHGKKPPALVSWCGNRIASGETRPRLSGKAASATPPAFRDLLLSLARSAR